VQAVHDGLPRGVSIAGNETGWREALAKLAALVEAGFPRRCQGPSPAATGHRVLGPHDCGGYEARRRWAGRFAGVGSCSALVVGSAFAKAFRSRLALRVATRSVVGGRASTSTRWIS
jgi:hypothetical protein